MLTEKQLQKLRKMLVVQKDEVTKNLLANEPTSLRDSVDELSMLANHPADLGTELFEREKDITIHAHRNDELAQIEKALAQMDEGTYGVCVVCKQPIPYDRLCAIPFTNVCVEHSETVEKITGEPVLHPFREEGVNALEIALEQGNLDAYDKQEAGDYVDVEELSIQVDDKG
ncbi:TraR/DksA C4-type zinc finger protein [Bacillus ndiopicus]|uniref:TraR/DksA C4-type zinc finger protein n=1 Tax=Bacillus ndiopicus TaxID=1347368 RepID=UPI0005A9BCCF|nr:TraR/DksA C4-type zinc finger protein [Bacillus ndiopicus]